MVAIGLSGTCISVAQETDALGNSAMEQRWGVKSPSIRLTNGGILIAFRFHVTDPLKAAAIFKEKDKAQLVDVRTGHVLAPSTLKSGSENMTVMRKEGPDLYMIPFSNPRKAIIKGMQVHVVIDEFRAENLTVR
jgi:hypothetical protein